MAKVSFFTGTYTFTARANKAIIGRSASGFKTLADPNHNRPLEGLIMATKALSKLVRFDKVDVETLRQCFSYNPETGALFWRHRPDSHFSSTQHAKTTNTRWAGREAFTAVSDKGYRYGNLFGKRRNAHGIIWAIVHGEYAGQIDHINGDRSDNRLTNLRSVGYVENARNQKTARNNTSGFRGVSYNIARKRWTVGIGAGGKWKHLGYFRCIGHAVRARKEAEIVFGYHPNHGRVQP